MGAVSLVVVAQVVLIGLCLLTTKATRGKQATVMLRCVKEYFYGAMLGS